MRGLWPAALVALALASAAGCRKPSNSGKAIVGLLAAAAPVKLETVSGVKQISVGSELRPHAKLTAAGPAVLEYFGGALRFLDKGEELEAGEAPEAKLPGPNLPQKVIQDRKVLVQKMKPQIIAAKYGDVTFPPEWTGGKPPEDSDYLPPFFVAEGSAALDAGAAEVQEVEAFRQMWSNRIHAGALGAGGLKVMVTQGFAVAETDDRATAVLLPGRAVQLGRTARLILPKEAAAAMVFPDMSTLYLKGPAVYWLR